MQVKLLLTIFLFISCIQFVCAQDSLTKIKIAEIVSIVKSIDNDKHLKKIVINNGWSDTLQDGRIYYRNDSLGPFTSYFSNGRLVKITQQYGLPGFQGGVKHYYFINGKLTCLFEDATNSSRMGSCGTLQIESSYFFSNDDIISSATNEVPFACYNLPLKTKEEVFSELAKMLKRLGDKYYIY